MANRESLTDIRKKIPYFFDSFAYKSKLFRIISSKNPGRISITVGPTRLSKSQYKRICDEQYPAHLHGSNIPTALPYRIPFFTVLYWPRPASSAPALFIPFQKEK